MRNQLKVIFNSTVAEFAICILICCWVTITVAFKLHGDWTPTAMTAGICEGLALIVLLIWCICMLSMRKPVSEMPSRPRRATELCSWTFLIYCVLVNIFPSLAWSGMALLSWMMLAACFGYYLNQKIEHHDSSVSESRKTSNPPSPSK